MWIVCALSAGAARAETPPVRWVRFEEADLERRLETAQVAFVHTAARAELTLIGMLHVAEPAYYEALRPELARFEAVFYEGIRGSLPELDRSIANYERLGRLFGLSRQADLLPARGPNFVHADLSVDELRQTMGARALEDDLRPGPEAAGLERLLADLASRPRNDHVKEELARRLGRAADEPHEHVLVRNARCWEVARAEVARRGGGRFAILYGAGHMPDLAGRLEEAGYRAVAIRWRTAWRVEAIHSLQDQLAAVEQATERAGAGPARRDRLVAGLGSLLVVAWVVQRRRRGRGDRGETNRITPAPGGQAGGSAGC